MCITSLLLRCYFGVRLANAVKIRVFLVDFRSTPVIRHCTRVWLPLFQITKLGWAMDDTTMYEGLLIPIVGSLTRICMRCPHCGPYEGCIGAI
jgi:hypothetical protein